MFTATTTEIAIGTTDMVLDSALGTLIILGTQAVHIMAITALGTIVTTVLSIMVDSMILGIMEATTAVTTVDFTILGIMADTILLIMLVITVTMAVIWIIRTTVVITAGTMMDIATAHAALQAVHQEHTVRTQHLQEL